ncbi:KTSC domain-containing protein [Devosia sp. RR2S18]|uniref:KTSC domain-containing protein n=1 Tax=Devosia rhizosphaerae TaxID=3049774 RepID=UPI002540B570|nr:KTSC domain-containing protein [Devosia sp. RR2S18]WIJ24381.1 KTSC domain-containing protein [Devosia sp. RR2S18]
MSSAIRHIHYKPELEELSVWFGPEGRRYKYFGVPSALYDALRQAPSRGRFFNESIRGRFECRLVDPSEKRNRRWQALRSAS